MAKKPLAIEMEEHLFDWTADRMSKKLRASRIMIMKKEKSLFVEM